MKRTWQLLIFKLFPRSLKRFQNIYWKCFSSFKLPPTHPASVIFNSIFGGPLLGKTTKSHWEFLLFRHGQGFLILKLEIILGFSMETTRSYWVPLAIELKLNNMSPWRTNLPFQVPVLVGRFPALSTVHVNTTGNRFPITIQYHFVSIQWHNRKNFDCFKLIKF